MVEIVPSFTQAAGPLGSVAEEQLVSIALGAVETITATGVQSQFFLKIGEAYARVSKLFIAEVEVPFRTDAIEKVILWDQSLPGPTPIRIVRSSSTPRGRPSAPASS